MVPFYEMALFSSRKKAIYNESIVDCNLAVVSKQFVSNY